MTIIHPETAEAIKSVVRWYSRRAADVLRDERTRDLFEEGWDD